MDRSSGDAAESAARRRTESGPEWRFNWACLSSHETAAGCYRDRCWAGWSWPLTGVCVCVCVCVCVPLNTESHRVHWHIKRWMVLYGSMLDLWCHQQGWNVHRGRNRHETLKQPWWNVTEYFYSKTALLHFQLHYASTLTHSGTKSWTFSLITLVTSYLTDYILHQSQRNGFLKTFILLVIRFFFPKNDSDNQNMVNV